MQIQLNYSDWQHASGRNVNADYLYEQVSSKNIPVVVMEPLLGGRLSNIPDHIFSRLKERNPEAVWHRGPSALPVHRKRCSPYLVA